MTARKFGTNLEKKLSQTDEKAIYNFRKWKYTRCVVSLWKPKWWAGATLAYATRSSALPKRWMRRMTKKIFENRTQNRMPIQKDAHFLKTHTSFSAADLSRPLPPIFYPPDRGTMYNRYNLQTLSFHLRPGSIWRWWNFSRYWARVKHPEKSVR